MQAIKPLTSAPDGPQLYTKINRNERGPSHSHNNILVGQSTGHQTAWRPSDREISPHLMGLRVARKINGLPFPNAADNNKVNSAISSSSPPLPLFNTELSIFHNNNNRRELAKLANITIITSQQQPQPIPLMENILLDEHDGGGCYPSDLCNKLVCFASFRVWLPYFPINSPALKPPAQLIQSIHQQILTATRH